MLQALTGKAMIPYVIFIVYVFAWACAIRFNPLEPDYIIASVMVVPFLAAIFPLLLFGTRLPPGYERTSMREVKHAPLKFIVPGTLFSGSPIFYLVSSNFPTSIDFLLGGLSIVIGSFLIVYAHKNKVKPRIFL